MKRHRPHHLYVDTQWGTVLGELLLVLGMSAAAALVPITKVLGWW